MCIIIIIRCLPPQFLKPKPLIRTSYSSTLWLHSDITVNNNNGCVRHPSRRPSSSYEPRWIASPPLTTCTTHTHYPLQCLNAHQLLTTYGLHHTGLSIDEIRSMSASVLFQSSSGHCSAAKHHEEEEVKEKPSRAKGSY